MPWHMWYCYLLNYSGDFFCANISGKWPVQKWSAAPSIVRKATGNEDNGSDSDEHFFMTIQMSIEESQFRDS